MWLISEIRKEWVIEKDSILACYIWIEVLKICKDRIILDYLILSLSMFQLFFTNKGILLFIINKFDSHCSANKGFRDLICWKSLRCLKSCTKILRLSHLTENFRIGLNTSKLEFLPRRSVSCRSLNESS